MVRGVFASNLIFGAIVVSTLPPVCTLSAGPTGGDRDGDSSAGTAVAAATGDTPSLGFASISASGFIHDGGDEMTGPKLSNEQKGASAQKGKYHASGIMRRELPRDDDQVLTGVKTMQSQSTILTTTLPDTANNTCVLWTPCVPQGGASARGFCTVAKTATHQHYYECWDKCMSRSSSEYRIVPLTGVEIEVNQVFADAVDDYRTNSCQGVTTVHATVADPHCRPDGDATTGTCTIGATEHSSQPADRFSCVVAPSVKQECWDICNLDHAPPEYTAYMQDHGEFDENMISTQTQHIETFRRTECPAGTAGVGIPTVDLTSAGKASCSGFTGCKGNYQLVSNPDSTNGYDEDKCCDMVKATVDLTGVTCSSFNSCPGATQLITNHASVEGNTASLCCEPEDAPASRAATVITTGVGIPSADLTSANRASCSGFTGCKGNYQLVTNPSSVNGYDADKCCDMVVAPVTIEWCSQVSCPPGQFKIQNADKIAVNINANNGQACCLSGKGAVANVQPSGRSGDEESVKSTDVAAAEKAEEAKDMTPLTDDDKPDPEDAYREGQIAGDSGPPGTRGPRGPVGPNGETGDVGPVGHPGDHGLQGPRGQTGQHGRHIPVEGFVTWFLLISLIFINFLASTACYLGAKHTWKKKKDMMPPEEEEGERIEGFFSEKGKTAY